MKTLFALMVAVCLWVGGCERPKVGGLVTNKTFVAAHTSVVLMPTMIGKSTILIPYSFYNPDRFYITVEPYDDTGAPLEVVRYAVTSEVYADLAEGIWSYPQEESFDHNKARKERRR